MKVPRSKNVTTDTVRPEQAQAVLFTPGALFFTHVTEWPPGVPSKDLPALVALSLEDISPFALESLTWGFCSDEESGTLFLYAACLPRIASAEQEAWPQAQQVYPAFAPLIATRCGANAAAPARSVTTVAGEAASGSTGTVEPLPTHKSLPAQEPLAPCESLPARELLLVGHEVLLLERAPAARWPRRIYSEVLDAAEVEEAFPQAVFESAARLLVKAGFCADRALAHGLLPTLPFWQLEQTVLDRRNEVRFLLRDFKAAVELGNADADDAANNAGVASAASASDFANASGAANISAADNASDGINSARTVSAGGAAVLETALVGEDVLWQADLRDDDFIAFTRKRRQGDQRLWYGLCAAAAAAVVLLVLLLGFSWLGAILKERTATLAAQVPAVERIRQDQDLLMRMRQFSADPFAPFNLIGTLKTGKPDAIYFDSIELSGPDSVLVEGQGPTVDAVNAYVRALEQGGGFRAARQARMNLKDGASVFTLYLQYLGQPTQVEAAPPES